MKRLDEKVFPAPAGVILAQQLYSNQIASFPRTCGGDPISVFRRELQEKFSPHLRG